MALVKLSDYQAQLQQAQSKATAVATGAQSQAALNLLKENAPFILIALGGLLAVLAVPALIEKTALGIVKDKAVKTLKGDKKSGKKPSNPNQKKKTEPKKTNKNKKGSKKHKFMVWDLERDLNELPEKPGIYRARDKDNKIIYIGKAKNLKKRVNAQLKYETPNSQPIIDKNINKLEYLVTGTVKEAEELERELIEIEKPPVNTYDTPKKRKPAKDKPKDKPPENKKGWVKLRIKDPSKFKPGSYKTKKANNVTDLVLAVPEDGGGLKLQSMRFKTEADLEKAIPTIEKEQKVTVVKTGNKWGVIHKTDKKEPKKTKENKKEPKPDKKGSKRPNITKIAKNFNKDIKPGDKVTYKSGRKSGAGEVSKVEENVFLIKDNETGETVKVLKTMVKVKK